jgi:hypothetical protein
MVIDYSKFDNITCSSSEEDNDDDDDGKIDRAQYLLRPPRVTNDSNPSSTTTKIDIDTNYFKSTDVFKNGYRCPVTRGKIANNIMIILVDKNMSSSAKEIAEKYAKPFNLPQCEIWVFSIDCNFEEKNAKINERVACLCDLIVLASEIIQIPYDRIHLLGFGEDSCAICLETALILPSITSIGSCVAIEGGFRNAHGFGDSTKKWEMSDIRECHDKNVRQNMTMRHTLLFNTANFQNAMKTFKGNGGYEEPKKTSLMLLHDSSGEKAKGIAVAELYWKARTEPEHLYNHKVTRTEKERTKLIANKDEPKFIMEFWDKTLKLRPEDREAKEVQNSTKTESNTFANAHPKRSMFTEVPAETSEFFSKIFPDGA